MNCPKCGKPMHYLAMGYRWDGSPATLWRCTAYPCWAEIYDGDPPWHVTICRDDLFLAYIEQYGEAPVVNSKPPADFALQQRLF